MILKHYNHNQEGRRKWTTEIARWLRKWNREIKKKKIDEIKLKEKINDFYPFPILEEKNKKTNFKLINKTQFNNQNVYKIYLDEKIEKDSIFFFFDTQTSLLLKKEKVGKKTTKITEYKNYKKIDGIMFPFTEILIIEIDQKIAQKTTTNFKEIIIISAASESGQLYGSVSAKDIAQEVTNLGLSINKSQVVLNKTLKTLSFEDVSIKLHPEVYVKLKLNIARSTEEATEQSKSGKAVITTEITGGDIRSERAQKDAKRFEKKNNDAKNWKAPEEISKTDNTDSSKKIENKDQNENNNEKENKEEE
jgi:ribosomal protein L9